MQTNTNPDRIAKGLYWDRAWYLVHGCRPRSPECARCWSAKGANMRQHNPHPKVAARHAGIIDEDSKHFNGCINLDHEALELPLRVRKPQTWAIWDDLFYGDEQDRTWCEKRGIPFEPVPQDFINHAFRVMFEVRYHTFFVLTKRAQRMEEITHWWHQSLISLTNVIGMTTAGLQSSAEINIPHLLKSPFALRGVSAEPLLGPLDLSPYRGALDWVIVGCESDGPRVGRLGFPSEAAWLEAAIDLVNQCRAEGVAVFVKQVPIAGRVSKDPAHWPAALHVRRFPM